MKLTSSNKKIDLFYFISFKDQTFQEFY